MPVWCEIWKISNAQGQSSIITAYSYVSFPICTIRCGVFSICAWVFQNLVSGRRTTPHFVVNNGSCGDWRTCNLLRMGLLKRLTLVICIILLMNTCAPLRAPVVVKNSPIGMFKYACISPTKELTSSTGSTYGGYGSSITKSVNPSDIIAGILIQNGFIIVPEIKSELAKETVIVNYGESGRRNRGFGYTIEVTIQFISADTNQMICSCTAEGQGSTEADDIRQAIRRALEGVFPEK